MTYRKRAVDRPLEETPNSVAAVEDDTAVPQFVDGDTPDATDPRFTAPGEASGDFPPTDDLIGDPHGAGAGSAGNARTGAEQPWDPEDLAVAQGHDPTPGHVERARRELDRDGPAAVERSVP